MMSVLASGYCAASFGALLGFVLGTTVLGVKQREVEGAYLLLAESVRDFLHAHPVTCGLIPTSPEELLSLKLAAQKAENLLTGCSATGRDER